MPVIAPIIAAASAVIGGIGTAVTAITGVFAGMGIFGNALLSLGLSVATGMLRGELAGKQKRSPGGVQFDRTIGTAVPRQVICGYAYLAGQDTYANGYGPSNYELQHLFTLSDYYCDGLSRMSIDGEWVTIEPTESFPARGRQVTVGQYAGLVWVKFFDGTQTTAFTALVNQARPSGRWTANHIGIGEAAALISTTFNDERNNSPPAFGFEVRGARLYDWRKDSTVGGSGSHRWGNYSTHEFTENPVVIEYNYRRGISVNGDLFCGMGMDPADLPLDKWTAAANICDEITDYGPRYRCAIILDCTATHGENIEAIQRSCGAITVDSVEGSWPIVGYDQPVMVTITDADLVTGAPLRWRGKRSQSDLVNSIAGNFPNRDEVWSLVGYETQTSPALVALDRRTRDLTMDFPQVPVGEQAAQLASIYFLENRFEATAEIVLPPRYKRLEAGDWLRWNSARYGNLVYAITEISLRASTDTKEPQHVYLTLQQRDGSIYDGVTTNPIVIPFPAAPPEYLSEVQSFALVPGEINKDGGGKIPAIRASWDAPNDVTVTDVELMYYPVSQPDAINYKTVPVSQTVVYLSENVVGNTQYRVRTRLRTDPAREVAWTTGLTVLTTNPPVAADVLLENIKGDAYATLLTIRSDINDANQRLDELIRQTTTGAAAQAHQTGVAVRVGSANAAALTGLSASVTTLDGIVTANAAAVTALSAQVGDVSGGGLWRMEVVAGTGDVVARLVVLMRATTGSDWVEVGTVWETGFVSGVPFARITNYANQFLVVNPLDDTVEPLFVIDTATDQVVINSGMLKVDNLAALSVNAGVIVSGILTNDIDNPTVVLDLDLGRFVVYAE